MRRAAPPGPRAKRLALALRADLATAQQFAAPAAEGIEALLLLLRGRLPHRTVGPLAEWRLASVEARAFRSGRRAP